MECRKSKLASWMHKRQTGRVATVTQVFMLRLWPARRGYRFEL
jgi:hypothetical protein